jgi:asparagine synthetase B (glutamine-hydrolysing)
MLDGEPSWLAVLESAAGSVATSATRPLSVRSTGSRHVLHVELGEEPHRPAVAEQGEIAVLLDGILLDRRPLVSAAGSRRLNGIEGDVALVLAAYLELGEAVLPLLRGSFGLLIWDGRRDRLLCARDPTDSHPLFFSRAGGRLVVSASHGALIEVGRVPADLDRVAIARWVVHGSTLPRRTFYARIERLPPGYVLSATPDAVGVRRYWHPGEQAPPGEMSPDQAVERLDELLDQAVARCAALGRLGVFLSGGVDSAVVAASATVVSRARGLPDPLALSYVYPDPNASEEATQRSIADGLGIPHRIVPLLDTVGPEGLLLAALRLTERSWMPCVNPWEPAFLRLAEQGAELGCGVVLSGEGGNDWFEADWYEAADLIRRLQLMRLRRLWSQERRAGRTGSEVARRLLWTFGGRVLVRDAVLASLGPVAGVAQRTWRRRRVASTWSEWALPDGAVRKALAAEFIERRSSERLRGYGGSARERTLEGVHLVVPMENRFLFSRTAGVHFLNPPVDPDLVQFLYGLPSALLNLGGRGKGLAWESVRRRAGATPAGLLGFADLEDFFASLLRAEGPRALEALGGLRRLSELGIVDERAFARALSGSHFGEKLSYNQAWQALACEAWLRKGSYTEGLS